MVAAAGAPGAEARPGCRELPPPEPGAHRLLCPCCWAQLRAQAELLGEDLHSEAHMRGQDREVGTNKTGDPNQQAPHPRAPCPHRHLLWGEWALTLPSWRFPSLLLPSQWPALPGFLPPLPHLRCPCHCPWASCRGTQGGRGRRPPTRICSDLYDLNGLVATLRELSMG